MQGTHKITLYYIILYCIPLVKLGYNDFDLFAKIKYSDPKQIQIAFKDTFVETLKFFSRRFVLFGFKFGKKCRYAITNFSVNLMQRPQKVELTVKAFEKDEKCGYETKVEAILYG